MDSRRFWGSVPLRSVSSCPVFEKLKSRPLIHQSPFRQGLLYLDSFPRFLHWTIEFGIYSFYSKYFQSVFIIDLVFSHLDPCTWSLHWLGFFPLFLHLHPCTRYLPLPCTGTFKHLDPCNWTLPFVLALGPLHLETHTALIPSQLDPCIWTLSLYSYTGLGASYFRNIIIFSYFNIDSKYFDYYCTLNPKPLNPKPLTPKPRNPKSYFLEHSHRDDKGTLEHS